MTSIIVRCSFVRLFADVFAFSKSKIGMSVLGTVLLGNSVIDVFHVILIAILAHVCSILETIPKTTQNGSCVNSLLKCLEIWRGESKFKAV